MFGIDKKLVKECGAPEPNLAEIKKILGKGANVNAIIEDGMAWTVLFYATFRGKHDLVQCLLENGATADVTTKKGETPLHAACVGGHSICAQLLMLAKGGAKAATVQTKAGVTPLFAASFHGRLSIVKLLLQDTYGKETIDIANHKEETPLIIAMQKGHEKIFEELLDSGAGVDRTDDNDWTLLHMASKCGNENIIKKLLARGADPLARTNQGKLPVDLAEKNRHAGVLELLAKAARDREDQMQEELLQKAIQALKEKEKGDKNEQPREEDVKDSATKEKSKNKSSKKDMSKNKDSQIQSRNPSFFQLLVHCHKQIHDTISAYEVHQELVQVLSNPSEFKIYYTLLRVSIQHGIISQERAKPLLSKALAKIAPLCVSEDALVIFKLIQDKCRLDGLLSEEDYHRFDNRAEVKRMEHADFICDMKESIQRNANKIEGLEGRVDMITENLETLTTNIETLDKNIRNVNGSIEKLQDAMKFKMKIEAGVCMVKACLNAVSFGIAGEFTQLFALVMNRIVDFGDSVHIVKVIDSSSTSSGNPQEGIAMKENFHMGVNIAGTVLDGASSLKVDNEMTKAIQEGRVLVAIGFAATIVHPSNVNSQHGFTSNPTTHIVPSAVSDAPLSQRAEVADDDAEFELWPDAVFDDDTEDDNLELHSAVKYSDRDTMVEFIRSLSSDGLNDDGLDKALNKVDSEGRSAVDLAALTGQTELMQVLEDEGVRFTKAKARMRVTAKKRSKNVEDYKRCIEESI